MTDIDDLAAAIRASLDAEERLARRLADRHIRHDNGLLRPELVGQRFWPTSHVRAVFRDLAIRDTRGKDPVLAEGLVLIEMFNPWRVLADVASKRALLDALLAEKHHVCIDQYYTCRAATVERDGGVYGEGDQPGPCDCGRDERVRAYLQLLAHPYQEQP